MKSVYIQIQSCKVDFMVSIEKDKSFPKGEELEEIIVFSISVQ